MHSPTYVKKKGAIKAEEKPSTKYVMGDIYMIKLLSSGLHGNLCQASYLGNEI
jgi:hypothetical protein